MTKKCLLMLAVAILILIAGFLYMNKDLLLKKDATDNPQDHKTSLVKDGFILETEYTSENMWAYKIAGQLPNPCYNAQVDVLVAESYPEQVTVSVKITEPEPDMVCIQVIQDYLYEGTFSASEEAAIELIVEQEVNP